MRQGEGRPPVQQVGQLAQLHALPADQVENGLLVPSLLSLQDHQHGLLQPGTGPCAMNATGLSKIEIWCMLGTLLTRSMSANFQVSVVVTVIKPMLT